MISLSGVISRRLDRSYMGGVERGERDRSFKKLCAIARALGRDVGSLTRGLAVRE